MISTATSKGYFSVQVGTDVGSPIRTSGDSANSMAQVFQNISNINGKLLSNGSPCTVTATAGKRRYARIKVAPASMGGAARLLSPDLSLDSVPNAVVAERAETLQGLRATNVLQVNTGGTNQLSQTNLESLFTSTARFNSLTAVVDGTSTSYMRSNSASGAQLPTMAGAPTSPTPGSIWYDTSDSKLKYQTSVGPIIVGDGSGTVTSVGLTAPSELSVAGSPLTTSGTIAVTWATQTANKVFAAPDGVTGTPAFRVLVANDIPSIPWTKITSLLPTTLLGYGITDAVKNNGGTPSIESGLNAAKGTASTAGRIWISTDTKEIYRDNGATWDLLGSTSLGYTPVNKAGDTMTGLLVLSADPSASLGAATKQYVDSAISTGAGDFKKDGSVPMTGTLKMGGNAIYGNSTSSGSLTLESTSDATKGFVLLQPNGGNVGIGTTSPVQKLDVNGNIGLPDSSHIYFGDAVTFATGIRGIDNQYVAMETNGAFRVKADYGGPVTIWDGSNSERMRIETSGNVGIGTTTPASSLHVVSANGSGINNPLIVQNNDVTKWSFVEFRNNSGTATGWSGYSNASAGFAPDSMVLEAAGNRAVNLVTNATVRLKVDGTGNVGVGTTSPVSKLDVLGNINLGGTDANGAYGLQFINRGDHGLFQEANTSLLSLSSIESVRINIDSNNNQTDRVFSIAKNGTDSGGSELFRVQENGNVGIGTTSPGQKLTVNGRIETTGGMLFNQGAGATDNMIFLNSTSPGAVNGSLGFFAAGVGSTGGTDGAYFLARGNNFSALANQRGNMYFAAGEPSSPGAAEGSIIFYTGANQRLNITNTGNVGIGTTSPSTTLDINGAQTFRGVAAASAPPASGQGKIYFDSTANKFKVSENNGAYVDLVGGGGGSGDVVGPGSSTDNAIVRFDGVTGKLVQNSGVIIDDSGNLGVGTSSPNAKLTVNGAATSRTNIVATGATVNLSLSNVHMLKSPGSSTITLQNIADGGTYTIYVMDTTARTYAFSGCTNTYFSPANTVTTFRSAFTITAMVDGANTECMISWLTGFN